jgi:glutathione peroxidase
MMLTRIKALQFSAFKTAHPLYTWLTHQAPGMLGSKRIKWNFTKFLVDRDGRVVKRFAPQETPELIEKHIKRLLTSTN